MWEVWQVTSGLEVGQIRRFPPTRQNVLPGTTLSLQPQIFTGLSVRGYDMCVGPKQPLICDGAGILDNMKAAVAVHAAWKLAVADAK